MLDLNYLRENMDAAIAGLSKRNIANAKELLQEVIAIDDKRKSTQFQLDEHLAKSNKLSKEIG
ncbi:MAG: serine--tRNA ligase, partial [Bacteroidetes bacterium]|nr:serine--tRNA ligase [Bacteroidota bacterium]